MGETGVSPEGTAQASLDPRQFAEWYADVLPRVYGYLSRDLALARYRPSG